MVHVGSSIPLPERALRGCPRGIQGGLVMRNHGQAPQSRATPTGVTRLRGTGASSHPPGVARLLQLQRNAGNSRVAGLLDPVARPPKVRLAVQRLHGASPQHFAVTGSNADNAGLTVTTTKTWASDSGSLNDLTDVDMREHVVFNTNPAVDIPSYPVVAPTIPGMTLVGNDLTKVAGAMHTGAGTDTHSGAGYGLFFTAPGGQPNLRRAAWTLVGTQDYEYRDRGAHGPWTPLHPGQSFTITRTMAMDPGTHEYRLRLTKTGPFGVNVTAGPTPIPLTSSEAIQDIGAARPDQTALWNALDLNLTNVQEHAYATIQTVNRNVGAFVLPVDEIVTNPRTVPPQSANRALLAPIETLIPAEYNPVFANAAAALDVLVHKYMQGMAGMPARVKLIVTKAAGVRQQACFVTTAAGPELRILFRYGKFATVDPTAKDTSMAGAESKHAFRTFSKNRRWQKATVIHEMGHMLHAFADMPKYQAATVDMAAAAAAPANIQPQMFKMAQVNDQIIQALAARHYPGRWQYAMSNPAEVVAEVWTAVMHGRAVPRGLAAVYLAYGGARNATIDNNLRRKFPHKQLPVLNTPEAAIPYI
jgi:hypothetical protein